MVTLALMAALAAPPWPAELHASPSPMPLRLAGAAAPKDAVLLRPGKPVRLTAEGPALLRLRFHGLLLRRGDGVAGPGSVLVRVDAEEPQAIELSTEPVPSWSVPRRPRWRVTQASELAVSLGPGAHDLVVWAGVGARLGAGLLVSIERDTAVADPAGPVAVRPQPQPVDPGGGAADDEPELVAGVETPAAVAAAGDTGQPGAGAGEPALMAGPSVAPEPALPSLEGFTVGAPVPQMAVVSGPSGAERFYQIDIQRGMELDCLGPGMLLLDMHAHRASARPESLHPVVVGLLIDEVLIQTVSLEPPASSAHRIEGASFTLSTRVTLRLPMEPGAHRVRVTLSDSAVLGASIRPRFEQLTDAPEPVLLSAEAARAGDLRLQDPMPPAQHPTPGEPPIHSGLAVVASAWAPASFSRAGWLVAVDGTAAVPLTWARLAVGLSAGLGGLSQSRRFADDRAATGVASSTLSLSVVPLLAEARWAAPLPDPYGVEVGIGGGAVLAWTSMTARGAELGGDLAITPAGVGQITSSVRLGPGALLVRVAVVWTSPVSSGSARDFEPGGTVVGLGYRLSFRPAE